MVGAAQIRLVIVDDHPLVGHGIASLLTNEPDIDVVGIGSSLADAAAFLAEPTPPDVMLLDVKLGAESGLDLLPTARGSATAIVVLTAHDFAPYLAAAHRLGAAGFVVKSAPFATLLDAIRRVAAGGLAFDRRPQAEVSLTPRERSVITHVLDGQTNDEIASALGITHANGRGASGPPIRAPRHQLQDGARHAGPPRGLARGPFGLVRSRSCKQSKGRCP
jgi:two-component system nitrate/nitrite response regulator NarL